MNNESNVKYASALLSLAQDEDLLVQYKATFKSFIALVKENPKIIKMLGSYFLDEKHKYAFVDEITEEFNLKNFSSFIKLLVRKHLIDNLFDIYREFIKLANENLGVKEGIVYSAVALNEKQLHELTSALSKRLEEEIELKNIVDTSLIGGVKLVVDGKIYDGSIKNHLNELKRTLLERKATL